LLSPLFSVIFSYNNKKEEKQLIRNFFNLKVADQNGHLYPASLKTKIKWILAGCPKQDLAKLNRLCRMRRNRLAKLRNSTF